ncbi:hypothetical protein LUZ63_000766 [Rhynchospora breviuscula]|uniref:Retrotransposon gag domain-containing protein n=1 Tax=Rhynchospora breviuscula TaxID=2022672 RepID=A0A9Q0CWI7_9POAL|nr:hypothetical protein LUZ63_000766 [Rhynchospora breviuscula]
MAGNGGPLNIEAETQRLEALRLQLEQREARVAADRTRLDNQRRALDDERRRWENEDESVHGNSDGEDAEEPARSLMEIAAPKAKDVAGPVIIPGIDANNMQIAPAHVTLVQQNPFYGNENEDPHAHLQTFIDCTRLIKFNGVPQQAIRLLLFRFTLKDRAQKWYKTLKKGSIRSWDAMAQTFLDRYFSSDRADSIRREINNFQKREDESMRDAWERFRDLENSCPHHGIQDWMVIKDFYNGLYDNIKINLDSLSGGAFKRLDATRARDLIDECARSYTWLPLVNNRRPIVKQQVHEITTRDTRIAELEAELAAYQSPKGTQVNYINDGTSYSSKYQYRNQNPPNLYRNVQINNNDGDQPFERKSVCNKEDVPIVVQEFMQEQTKFNQVMVKDLNELKANAGTLTRIERMMEAHFSRQLGKLPSQPEVNPNAECKSLHTLRSGTQYNDPLMPIGVEAHPPSQGEGANEQEEPVLEQVLPFPPLQGAVDATGAQTGAQAAQKAQPEPEFWSEIHKFRSEISGPEPKKVIPEKKKGEKSEPEAAYMPPLPFPKRLARENEAMLFKRFWEMLREVHITIPFADVFTKVPIYAKFLKELCTGKRSLEELKTVVLTDRSSEALKSKMPPKLEDPGRFALTCVIGNAIIKQALCDMGASVSLMPKTVFERIGFGELRPTDKTIQLADSSKRLPMGEIKDVPVQVGKFLVPGDFIVMDMEEDREVPIILGRPFLRTAGVMMDARDGTIIVRVGGETLRFSIEQAMKCPSSNNNSCFMIEEVEPTIEESLENQYEIALNSYQNFLSDVQEAIGVEETMEELEYDQNSNETHWTEKISDRNLNISDQNSSLEEVRAADTENFGPNSSISVRNLAPQVELKPLPATVRYEFLGPSQKYPVIANSKLDAGQKKKLLVEKGAIGYSIDDLKGIDPSTRAHEILLKDVLTKDTTNEGYDKSLAVSLSKPDAIKT